MKAATIHHQHWFTLNSQHSSLTCKYIKFCINMFIGSTESMKLCKLEGFHDAVTLALVRVISPSCDHVTSRSANPNLFGSFHAQAKQ